MVLLVLANAACTPTPAPFDLQATLDEYYSNLPSGWGEISPTELNKQLSSPQFLLVDVRESKEVASAGFIAGSINLPIHTFLKNLSKLPAQDRAIVVICGTGQRSALAMQALQLLGYTNVKSLVGGLTAWKSANLPIVTGTPLEAAAGKTPTVDKNLLATLDTYLSGLPDGWNAIAPVTLRQLLNTSQPFQVDVREPKEIVDSGSIANSTNIPIRTLFKNLTQLPPDKGATIIVECDNGQRSAMVMMALSLLGYTNVRNLAGGFATWANMGLPITK